MGKRSAKKRYAIIGAGPCGLGAGWRLTELGADDFRIYETSGYPGGLASSYRDGNGFLWDVGGHVLHSHYPYFDAVFEEVLQGEYITHKRESWIRTADRFVPYPFQNNIHRLPPKIRDACLAGLKSRKSGAAVHTFADWILASYGQGIAEYFLYPYNRKVWAYPPEKMNYAWVGDRVADVNLPAIEENIRRNRDDISWGPNATFAYPARGGTGAIWKRVSDRFAGNIRYNKTVVSVDVSAHTLRFDDGTTASYDKLLSTMPLTRLVSIIGGTDEFSRVPSLHASGVTIVGLGMKGSVPDHMRTKCWMYFPDDSVVFFRATVLYNYAPDNAPEGTWSLMTETAFSPSRRMPAGDITEAVIRSARTAGLVRRTDRIIDTWTFTAAYGYPTPTLDRDAQLASVLPRLASHGIYSRGRFGAWKYEVSNQDHTFMQGVEWADHVTGGREEYTVVHANAVNNRT